MSKKLIAFSAALMTGLCSCLGAVENDRTLAFEKHGQVVKMKVFDGFLPVNLDEEIQLEEAVKLPGKEVIGVTMDVGPVIASVVQVSTQQEVQCSVDQSFGTECSTWINNDTENSCSTLNNDGNIEACSIKKEDYQDHGDCSTKPGQEWKCSALSGSTLCSTGYSNFPTGKGCSTRGNGGHSAEVCSVENVDCSVVNETDDRECSVDGTAGNNGFCSAKTGHQSGGQDAECSAYSQHDYCSATTNGGNGALYCSIESQQWPDNKGGKCSADFGKSCSVSAGDNGDPPGACSIFGGEEGQCSTWHSGFCSVSTSDKPSFCSIQQSGKNGFCSVVKSPPTGSCSAVGNSRCSVMYPVDPSNTCTTAAGINPRTACSVGGNNKCSTMMPNGGIIPPVNGVCDGYGNQGTGTGGTGTGGTGTGGTGTGGTGTGGTGTGGTGPPPSRGVSLTSPSVAGVGSTHRVDFRVLALLTMITFGCVVALNGNGTITGSILR